MRIKDIGKRIVELREERGYSQKELAQLIPVSQPTLSRWENGTIIPSVDQLEHLCTVLGVRLEHVLLAEETAEYEKNRIKFRWQSRMAAILAVVVILCILYLVIPRYRVVATSDIHDNDYGSTITLYVKPVFGITETGSNAYAKKLMKRYEGVEGLTSVEVVFVKSTSDLDNDENIYFVNDYFLRQTDVN